MPTRRLMHVREITQAAHVASLHADQYQIARAPIYRPRRWLADKLAEAYHRGAADMARRVLTGHARPVRTDGPSRDSGTHEAVVGLEVQGGTK